MSLKAERYSSLVTENYFLNKKIQDLGITKKYIAYYYLIEIMDMLVNNSLTVRSFSHDVYPHLANKFNKNQSTVERDIRIVIDRLWDKTVKYKLYVFWGKQTKPRCREFIYMIKAYILNEIS